MRDAALLLSAIAGFNPRDPFSLPEPPRDFRDRIEDGVAGLRIGLLQSPGFTAPADADSQSALAAAQKILTAAGAIVEPANINLPDTSDIFTKIWGAALARLVSTIAPEKRAFLDDGLLSTAQRFQNVTASEMLEAEALRVQAAHAMATSPFDAFLCPCVPHAAPLADVH